MITLKPAAGEDWCHPVIAIGGKSGACCLLVNLHKGYSLQGLKVIFMGILSDSLSLKVIDIDKEPDWFWLAYNMNPNTSLP